MKTMINALEDIAAAITSGSGGGGGGGGSAYAPLIVSMIEDGDTFRLDKTAGEILDAMYNGRMVMGAMSALEGQIKSVCLLLSGDNSSGKYVFTVASGLPDLQNWMADTADDYPTLSDGR